MKPKAIVCGTTFGRIYLAALQRPDQPYALAGIVARGSARSRHLAQQASVPLYTSVKELPDNIALACVVVRAGMVGGAGTSMALELLERGIAVVQEHPVSGTELALCLRAAHARRVPYRISTLYPWILPVQRFVALLKPLAQAEAPLFVDAIAGVQVGCTLLDILGHAFGGLRPFSFGAPATMPTNAQASPYVSLDGQIAGIPLHLRLQNEMDPQDPDNYFHVMHRITVGFPSGNLTLHDTHGPVVWSRRFHVPRVDTGEVRLEVQLDSTELLAARVRTFSPSEPLNLQQVLSDVWPAGIARLLREIHRAAQDDPLRGGQRQLDLCHAWEALTAQAGPTRLGTLKALGQSDMDAAERILQHAWEGCQ